MNLANQPASVPLISVIVCTYNRQDMIIDCLNSLLEQDIPKDHYEVVIVDNASTDNTAVLIREFLDNKGPVNFSLVTEHVVGLSYARNTGVALARAPYVAFIDDDARAASDWLSVAEDLIHQENPDIFGGPAWPIFPNGKPPWYKTEYGIRGDMGETGLLKPGGFLIGTNIFFRRSMILKYGGFDPALGMTGNTISYHEETSLLNRARAEGKKIYYSKELAVEDVIPEYKLSLAFLLYSKYKAGKDIWKFQEEEPVTMEPTELLAFIDQTFGMFNNALLDRDVSKYPYPENYLYENVPHQFYHIGKMVEYFLAKTRESS